MFYAKKLFLAPVFLITFAFLTYKISEILNDYQFLFSLDNSSLTQILTLCVLFILTSLSFVLFATFANNWKIIAPTVLIAFFSPLIFTTQPVNFILGFGFLIAFIVSYLTLENKLKTYLNFQPSVLLTPSIKNLTTILIFVTSFGFYLTISTQIKQNGFTLPDSLIDTILQAMPMPDIGDNAIQDTTNNLSIPGLPQINQQQITLLKQNPQLLQQYGIDPKMLDSFDLNPENNQNSIPNPIQNSVKDLVKRQLEQALKPFISFIPAFLGLTLFLTLNWIASILSLFLPPTLWIIFGLLTKSNFITFTSEMREVKKLVV